MTYRIPVSRPSVTALEREYVLRALDAGQLSPGAMVREFEERFAAYVGGRYAVACCSGTAALRLAIEALDVDLDSSNVHVPALTFAATAAAVREAGLTAVLCDVDPVTWCADPVALDEPDLLAVSLYGNHQHAPWVVDNAECFGRGVHCGLASCYSLYGNKTIAAGVGGVVVTNVCDTMCEMRERAAHGVYEKRGRFHQVVPGLSVRMGELQAAVGLAQLQRADELLEQRRQIAAWYRARIDVAHPPADCQQPWLVNVLVDHRDEVQQRMGEAGIETREVFPCLADLPPYRFCARVGGLPVARSIAARGLSLPLWPGMSEDDVGVVCGELERATR